LAASALGGSAEEPVLDADLAFAMNGAPVRLAGIVVPAPEYSAALR